MYGDLAMQTVLFRLGAITASSDFLAVIPRPAMVQAIRRHATEARPIRDGHPILSDSTHGNRGFYLLTAADRRWTAIWLAEEVEQPRPS
jgi:hypothetical protein